MKYCYAIILLILAGCSSQPTNLQVELPTWVTTLPINSGWVYGVGSAEVGTQPAVSAQLARQRARLDLMRSLQSRLQGQTTVKITADNESVDQQISQTVRSSVPENMLLNVELLETSTRNNQIFVLVGLERIKEVHALRARQIQLEVESQNWSPSQEVSLPELRKLVYWNQQRREWLSVAAQIQIVSGRPQRIEEPVYFAEINEFMAYLQERVVFRIHQFDDEAISISGWPESTDSGTLELSLDIDFQSNYQDGTFYQFITGSLELRDLISSDLLQQAISIRGVSSVESRSRQNARNLLVQQIDQFVAQILPDPKEF